MFVMGIFGRGSGSADQWRQDIDDEGGDRLGDVLLVLDGVIEALELVAAAGGDRSTGAAERVDRLQEIRRELRPPEQDSEGMVYGRGEWARDLCWLFDQQSLIDLYRKDR
jgi:hypothetical protein